MLKKLDLKDRKLLFELDWNSRQSSSAIAKKLRMKKSTVNFRIQRLIKENYILGFYPSVDISRLGYLAFRVYLQFFNTNEEKEKKILNYLISNKQCGVVAELEAAYDIMFMFITTKVSEFNNFWNKFKREFREYFYNEKIHLFKGAIHSKRRYLSDKKEPVIKKEEEIIGGHEKVKFDEKDLKILSKLAKNCRIPALEISKTAKIPARTIAYKIREMERKGIIQGYRINLNLEKLGLEYYKINFRLNKTNKMDELTNFCIIHPKIIFIDYSLSNYDFEIDVEVKNKSELMTIIKEMKNKFIAVRNCEILTFRKYYKLESIPRF